MNQQQLQRAAEQIREHLNSVGYDLGPETVSLIRQVLTVELGRATGPVGEAQKPPAGPTRTGRIDYGGYAQHTVHYVIADDTKEMIKVSETSRKIAGDRMVEQQKKKRAQGYTGPFGLPHHCFSFNEAVSFTVDEAGEAVIIF